MNRAAVIFDMDGVLVDSYQPHLASWQQLGRECGVSFTPELFAATFGRTSRDIICEVWPKPTPSDEQIATLDDRKESLYRKIIAADFPAMDGATDLIDALVATGFSLAAGSSGPPANIALALEKLDRASAFAATIDGTKVSRGKPDPQVFLLAAEALGVSPGECIVVEDAPAGVEAARRAGMASVGLASTGRTAAELSAADLVVTSLEGLTVSRIRELLDG